MKRSCSWNFKNESVKIFSTTRYSGASVAVLMMKRISKRVRPTTYAYSCGLGSVHSHTRHRGCWQRAHHTPWHARKQLVHHMPIFINTSSSRQYLTQWHLHKRLREGKRGDKKREKREGRGANATLPSSIRNLTVIADLDSFFLNRRQESRFEIYSKVIRLVNCSITRQDCSTETDVISLRFLYIGVSWKSKIKIKRKF